MPNLLFALLFVLMMMALFAAGFKLFANMTRKPIKKRRRSGEAGEPGVCPVCGIVLEDGQKIQSALFPGKGDRMCHIYGCPSCLSLGSAIAERRACPVCKMRIGPDEYLVARVFERGGKRQHVHVLGCVNCRMG